MNYTISIPLVLLLLCGCSTTIRFVVIDKVTGEPLAGVTATHLEILYYGIMNMKRIDHPAVKSDQNGIIELSKIRTRNRVHSLVFNKEGYQDAAVVYHRDRNSVEVISPYATNSVTPGTFIPLKSGVNTIRVTLKANQNGKESAGN